MNSEYLMFSSCGAATQELNKLPKVSGNRVADRLYVDGELDDALRAAEAQAKSMHDEFVSVEHLFLGLLEAARGAVKQILELYRIQKERVLQALQGVRGSQRVTTDNPEGTYDALEKYGTDLVKRAREQKMDPVIGRDEEIRNDPHPFQKDQKQSRADRRTRRG